ncbi:DUF421 domain-containing protein [Salinarchaeum laminariae]|uniref:DUF421 domain-containing protein n=1 Tax=Salinarchaeum laminariae TaxID=869888 RepID=UPI0020C146F4|nr:YetF domain-containing protein [Salinarchaeum laminariae]
MTRVTYVFDGWEPIFRTIAVGVAIYVILVISLRISGSRTLAKMNAFDFIVTIAIGAVFGSSMISSDVALAQTVTALALLLGMQYVVGKSQTRWPWFERLVTNPPSLLYYRGEFLEDAMLEERLSEADLRSAVRKKQLGSFEDVEAIVLETGGDVSIVTSVGDESALGDLPPDELGE